jgi:putative hydrolase of the HAD superfamily
MRQSSLAWRFADWELAVGWTGFGDCEAIFFDLDDTLIDFGGSTERCWEQACAELVSSDAGYSPAEIRSAIAAAGAWYWSDAGRHRLGRADLLAATRDIVTLALERIGVLDDALVWALAARYRELRDAHIAVYDGAVETLDALRDAGHRLGLITNGAASDQRGKLARFDLARHFAYIGIEGEAGVGKPEADAYWRALRALDCAPAAAWMVGDNLEWDVIGAQQVGLRTVWIDGHRRGLPDGSAARPHHIAVSVTELAAFR